jgi:hypothetical protein
VSGLRATAPCGHAGEVVIGTFIKCLTKGCDGVPKKPAAAAPTIAKTHYCPSCRSLETERFLIDGSPLHVRDKDAWHCWSCGDVFWVDP